MIRNFDLPLYSMLEKNEIIHPQVNSPVFKLNLFNKI